MTEPKSQPSGSSRRRHRRVAARGISASVRADDAVSTVPVVNISTGGMLVGGGHQLPRGTPLTIELSLKGSAPLTLSGRALYSVTDGVGVAFEPLTVEAAAQLEKLISAVDAKNTLPPPLPTRRTTGEVEQTASAFTPVGDPKPPRSGSADDRAEYLRTLVKNRDDANARGHAALTALAAEAEGLRAKVAQLTTQLEAASTQHRLGEAALAAAREATQAAANAYALKIEEEKHRTREAFAAVSGLEAKLRHRQGELEAARAEARAKAADVAALAHLQEELVQERAKVVEADRALLNSDEAYEASNAARLLALSEVADLKAKLEKMEENLRRQASAPKTGKHKAKSDPGDAPDQRQTARHTAFDPEAKQALDQATKRCQELEAEVARLKRRLIATEAALEAKATKRAPARPTKAK